MITPLDMTGREGVVSAIRTASAETGADFGYLMRTAMRESSLDPNAKAATSSATGLFQFIEQTWLGVVARHGADHGLSEYAEAIEQGADGRFRVADTALRQEILALRKDPEIAARMAGELTAEHRDMLERRIGRSVTQGELYAAHFLGPGAAARLIAAVTDDPQAVAADLFPQAAAANRAIFYAKDGTARSVDQVYARLTRLPDDVSSPAAGEAVAQPPILTAGLRGATFDEAPWAPPSAAAADSAGWPRAALVLTPQVIEILAALDPIPVRPDETLRARTDGREDRGRAA